jgi:type I restriction enzyme, R subunit
MIIDHLTECGTMDARLLYDSPFTDRNPMGLGGVFDPSDAANVVAILDGVRQRAVAQDAASPPHASGGTAGFRRLTI